MCLAQTVGEVATKGQGNSDDYEASLEESGIHHPFKNQASSMDYAEESEHDVAGDDPVRLVLQVAQLHITRASLGQLLCGDNKIDTCQFH